MTSTHVLSVFCPSHNISTPCLEMLVKKLLSKYDFTFRSPIKDAPVSKESDPSFVSGFNTPTSGQRRYDPDVTPDSSE